MMNECRQVLLLIVLGHGLAGQLEAEMPADNSSDHGWFARVDRTRAEEPSWITPIVTSTPRLEEKYRFDFFHQEGPAGSRMENFGGSKGLDLIPARNLEITIGVPPYLIHSQASALNGWGDAGFAVRYRLLSSNEKAHDHLVTLLFAASAPTATHGNGAGHWLFTPSLAAGKGRGNLVAQSSFGVTLPGGAVARLGTPLAWNTAFQYRVLRKLWPEMEVNSTFWPNGSKSGKNQVFLTPGLVAGRFHLWKRAGLTFGAGMQIAITRFHTYNHNLILTARLPF
jgi:hypothetical protein